MKRAAIQIRLAALLAVCGITLALAAPAPPSAETWNIAPSGTATSSGELAFRITATDGAPVEVAVPVQSGATEDDVARAIQRTLGSRLQRGRFKVEIGQGSNVLVRDSRGRPNITVELIDSDIENLRVAVQSVTPSATPTVPPQSTPAVPPPVSNPEQTVPGNAAPPPNTAPAIIIPPDGAAHEPIPVPDPVRVPSPSQSVPPPPSVPAPAPSAPPSNRPMEPSTTTPPGATPPETNLPPNATGGAGASATAPPPSSSPPRQ